MPDTDQRDSTPPFEQAALEELERLQHELGETRKRRRAANDAFDAFLKTFGRSPAESAAGRPSGAESKSPVAPAVAASGRVATSPPGGIADDAGRAQSADLVVDQDQDVASAEAQARVTRTAHEATAGPRPAREPLGAPLADPIPSNPHQPGRPDRQSRIPRGAPLAFAAIILAAAVAFIPCGRESVPEETSEDPPGALPADVELQGAPPAPAQVSPAAVPGAELIALRRVWVRVTVDGERVLERELQPDARVPLAAGGTIVVRAGDGGAIRLSVDGEDQGTLGADGEVVTRTFTPR